MVHYKLRSKSNIIHCREIKFNVYVTPPQNFPLVRQPVVVLAWLMKVNGADKWSFLVDPLLTDTVHTNCRGKSCLSAGKGLTLNSTHRFTYWNNPPPPTQKKKQYENLLFMCQNECNGRIMERSARLQVSSSCVLTGFWLNLVFEVLGEFR